MKMKKIIILTAMSLVILLGLPSPSNYSLASTASTDGFIIEASQIEGKLGLPGIVLGDTASKKGVPMIELSMDDMSVEGMVITKVSQTPNGPLTTKIKSNGTAKLKNMKIRITNMEFEEMYIPKLGYIGMKNAKLLAYQQTASYAELPSFSFGFDHVNSAQMNDKNKEELKQMLIDLDKAVKGEDDKEKKEEKDKETDKDAAKDKVKATDEEKDPKTEEPKPEEEPTDPVQEDPIKKPEPPPIEDPTPEPPANEDPKPEPPDEEPPPPGSDPANPTKPIIPVIPPTINIW